MAEFPSPANDNPALQGWTDRAVLALRGPKAPVDPWRPYAFLTEPERTATGRVEPVATLFLTNRECRLRCVMCDLWRHTTDATVPQGAIPAQIDYAMSRLPPARHAKLYNSGNFFDPRSIPPADHPAIAQRMRGCGVVTVENHPRLLPPTVEMFRDLLAAEGAALEVALGLETIDGRLLKRLNKRMTLDDMRRAIDRLREEKIAVRLFVLLRPPGATEAQGRDLALAAIDWAWRQGAGCVAVIPTRDGNGAMERLAELGAYAPPRITSLEQVLEQALPTARGRVFVDLWDAERFAPCPVCRPLRLRRLHAMNLSQTVIPPVACACGGTS